MKINTSCSVMVDERKHHQVFIGPAGSGKTIEMLKEFNRQFPRGRANVFVVDSNGDVKRALGIKQLTDWCGCSKDFESKIKICNDISEVPDSEDSCLIMDTGRFDFSLRNRKQQIFATFQTARR